jgi:hypothetical protein
MLHSFPKEHNMISVINTIVNPLYENSMEQENLFSFQQKTRQFINCLYEENFEYGKESQSHLFVRKQMMINPEATKEWLSELYIDNFQKTDILIGILRVISRFTREEINPIGDTIALAALLHKDEEVQETAIRAFESWGGEKSLKILQEASVTSKWVQEYLSEVISDLRAELC